MHLFNSKQSSKYQLFDFKVRKPTIEEICSGKIYDVKKAIELAKLKRSQFFGTTNGYTKTRTKRLIAEIPFEVFQNKELKKYFDSKMDKHERRKNLFAFLKKHSQFMTVDKL